MILINENECDKIETGPDRLLSLVNEKEQISLTGAANTLKIPKSTVQDWMETLEEAGLLITKQTLREKFILSTDYHKTNTQISSFMHQLRSIKSDTRSDFDRKLEEKTKLVDERIRLLDKKLKDWKEFQALRQKIEEKSVELKRKESEFRNHAKAHEQTIRSLEQREARLKGWESELAKKEAQSLQMIEKSQKRIEDLMAEEKRALSSISESKKELEKLSRLAKLKEDTEKTMKDVVDEKKELFYMRREQEARLRELEKQNRLFEEKSRELSAREARLRAELNDYAIKARVLESMGQGPVGAGAVHAILENEGVTQLFAS